MAFNKKISLLAVMALLLALAGGGWYARRHLGHDHGAGKADQGKILYTCSMHPFIIKDKPGTCPICGMELIKKIDGAADGTAQTPEQKQQAEMLGQVSLSPTQRVMANVATVEAKQQALNKEINAVGIVQFDQSRQAKVTAWIAGRIDKLNRRVAMLQKRGYKGVEPIVIEVGVHGAVRGRRSVGAGKTDLESPEVVEINVPVVVEVTGHPLEPDLHVVQAPALVGDRLEPHARCVRQGAGFGVLLPKSGGSRQRRWCPERLRAWPRIRRGWLVHGRPRGCGRFDLFSGRSVGSSVSCR